MIRGHVLCQLPSCAFRGRAEQALLERGRRGRLDTVRLGDVDGQRDGSQGHGVSELDGWQEMRAKEKSSSDAQN